MEPELRIKKSDHTCEKLLLFCFAWIFEFLQMFNSFFHWYLLLVNFNELSFSLLFYFIRHLRLTHLRKICTNFFVNSFQTFEISFCHFAAWGCQEYRLKNKSKQLFAELSFFKHNFIIEMLVGFNVLSDWNK